MEELQATPDGGNMWVNVSIVPLKGSRRETIGTMGIYENITERKKAEEAFKESETKFRALFENVPLQAVIYRFIGGDDNGKIVDWELTDINSLGAASIGMKPAEALGRRAIDLFGEEVMTPYLETSRRIAASGKPLLLETHFNSNRRDYLSSNFWRWQ